MALLTDELMKELQQAYPDLTAVQLFPLAQAEATMRLHQTLEYGDIQVTVCDTVTVEGGLDVSATNSFT